MCETHNIQVDASRLSSNSFFFKFEPYFYFVSHFIEMLYVAFLLVFFCEVFFPLVFEVLSFSGLGE